MRTARVLTVSPSMLCVGGCTWSRGCLLPGECTWSQAGVPGHGGAPCPGGGVDLLPGGVYLLLGGVCSWWRGVYLVPGGCTWSWGCTWSQGGVCSQGVHLVWGCTWSQGGWPGPRGVSAPWGGGCTWSWGCLLQGLGVSGTPPCEQNDKQVQKYYLAPNFVCGR